MAGGSPTTKRRRLGAALRELRQAAGLTHDDVAAALLCSVGKISHLETARYNIALRDVRDLLNLYGVAGEQFDDLMELCRASRERGWWYSYKDALRKYFGQAVGLEPDADAIRTYEPLLMPGLLQTEEYARAVVRDGGPRELTDEEVELRVKARMLRQERLTDEEPPLELWAVIEEALLHRPVGGPEVLRAQLTRLAELARWPHITVQVLPTAVGVHPGACGSFLVMEFPDEEDPDVVYIDAVAGELYLDKPEEVRLCKLVFTKLCSLALPPTESRQAILAAAKELAGP